MRVYEIDPIQDARWAELVKTHPKASVFHTVAWLKALRTTYNYEPVAFTTSDTATRVTNGLLFCRVKSSLTGRRLVSLPFSDHCEPLCDSGAEFGFLIRDLQSALTGQHFKYLEFRPITASFGQAADAAGFIPAAKYYLHRIDLRPEPSGLFSTFHKDSVQRRVQRADRAALVEIRGTSNELLEHFYRLFLLTRRRHQLPPIPRAWFQSLIQYLRDAVEISVAYANRKPIAAILTLRFRDVVYYKYGCSDRSFNRLGAIPWLLWKAMLAARSKGALQFDMGRTEEGNPGLLKFKNHWNAQPQELIYWNFPTVSGFGQLRGWKLRAAKRVFSFMPGRLLAITGRIIYRHIG
jgi:lipid II:glycine glycyltransferase (peptidoglycan interpeptide bridge formation enzyme)